MDLNEMQRLRKLAGMQPLTEAKETKSPKSYKAIADAIMDEVADYGHISDKKLDSIIMQAIRSAGISPADEKEAYNKIFPMVDPH